MTNSLAALLEGAIDYAGLFPPAALGMAAAWNEYQGHLAGEEEWVVNRFAVTAARLGELAEIVGPTHEAALTVIGSDPVADLKLIEEFEKRFEGRIVADGYEVRVGRGDVPQTLRKLGKLSQRDVFFEVSLGEGQEDDLNAIAQSEAVSAKARLGGTTPGSHPHASDVAGFIAECLDLGLGFKLTAGLHHPYPTQDALTGDQMHGFLNVLMATALAESESLSRGEIMRILEAESGFEFSDTAASFQGWSASLETIDDTRSLFAGIGSCCIQESLNDLSALGLL